MRMRSLGMETLKKKTLSDAAMSRHCDAHDECASRDGARIAQEKN